MRRFEGIADGSDLLVQLGGVVDTLDHIGEGKTDKGIYDNVNILCGNGTHGFDASTEFTSQHLLAYDGRQRREFVVMHG